jgi:hypothetical protein
MDSVKEIESSIQKMEKEKAALSKELMEFESDLGKKHRESSGMIRREALQTQIKGRQDEIDRLVLSRAKIFSAIIAARAETRAKKIEEARAIIAQEEAGLYGEWEEWQKVIPKKLVQTRSSRLVTMVREVKVPKVVVYFFGSEDTRLEYETRSEQKQFEALPGRIEVAKSCGFELLPGEAEKLKIPEVLNEENSVRKFVLKVPSIFTSFMICGDEYI